MKPRPIGFLFSNIRNPEEVFDSFSGRYLVVLICATHGAVGLRAAHPVTTEATDKHRSRTAFLSVLSKVYILLCVYPVQDEEIISAQLLETSCAAHRLVRMPQYSQFVIIFFCLQPHACQILGVKLQLQSVTR